MRIGVRSKCQRQGIGRQLMDYLFAKYPRHLSLDVSTDNVKAVAFYKRVGLAISSIYLSEEKVEFAKFETPPGFQAPKRFEEKKKEETTSRKSESDVETVVSESEETKQEKEQIVNVIESLVLAD